MTAQKNKCPECGGEDLRPYPMIPNAVQCGCCRVVIDTFPWDIRSVLTRLLDLPADADYDKIHTGLRDLKRRLEQATQIENIIGVLRGIDVLTGVMDRIEIQLSDEAVYEHLKTCADVLDDEDHKRMLRDAAELFADEFCNGENRKSR